MRKQWRLLCRGRQFYRAVEAGETLSHLPLFPHATGRWAKKIRGRLVYFGPWADPDAALRKYLARRDDLHSGRTLRPARDGLTVRELANNSLTAKELQRDAGEIKGKTFGDSFATCKLVVGAFGKTRLVDDLAADDFNALRASFAKRLGVHGVSREVQPVRTLFKYGYESGLLFVTRQGRRWFKDSSDCPLSKGFRKLVGKLLL